MCSHIWAKVLENAKSLSIDLKVFLYLIANHAAEIEDISQKLTCVVSRILTLNLTAEYSLQKEYLQPKLMIKVIFIWKLPETNLGNCITSSPSG